jgi:hypothetical protein
MKVRMDKYMVVMSMLKQVEIKIQIGLMIKGLINYRVIMSRL